MLKLMREHNQFLMLFMTICMLTSFILMLKKVVICILDMNILIKRDLFVLEQTELMIDNFLSDYVIRN